MTIPRLYYVTTGLDPNQAFATWSTVLSPLFEPRPWIRSKTLPAGSANGAILGDIVIAKVSFEPQMFVRDGQRIASTPDHILLHLYMSGGFNGKISGEQVSIGPGKVAVIDLAHEVKSSTYKVISIAVEAPAKPEPAAKEPKAPKAPKPPKEALDIETLTCPKCKEQLLRKGHTAYGCANFQACGFKIPFETGGKKLTDKQVADLVQKGKTGKIKGLQTPEGAEAAEGRISLDSNGALVIS